MSDRPTLAPIFSILFSPQQSQDAQNEYQAALERAKQCEEMQDENAEEKAKQTVRLYGRACGVTSWDSARENN